MGDLRVAGAACEFAERVAGVGSESDRRLDRAWAVVVARACVLTCMLSQRRGPEAWRACLARLGSACDCVCIGVCMCLCGSVPCAWCVPLCVFRVCVLCHVLSWVGGDFESVTIVPVYRRAT